MVNSTGLRESWDARSKNYVELGEGLKFPNKKFLRCIFFFIREKERVERKLVLKNDSSTIDEIP